MTKNEQGKNIGAVAYHNFKWYGRMTPVKLENPQKHMFAFYSYFWSYAFPSGSALTASTSSSEVKEMMNYYREGQNLIFIQEAGFESYTVTPGDDVFMEKKCRRQYACYRLIIKRSDRNLFFQFFIVFRGKLGEFSLPVKSVQLHVNFKDGIHSVVFRNECEVDRVIVYSVGKGFYFNNISC